MTGPENYREAERLLGLARDLVFPIVQEGSVTERQTATDTFTTAAALTALAQVHATLADAAANAGAQATAYDGDETNSRTREWARVI